MTEATNQIRLRVRPAFLAVFSSSLLTCILHFQPAAAADGSLDTSFGESGKITTSVGEFDAATAITVLQDGKILVAGTTRDANSNKRFVHIRYQANGMLDSTYGNGGISVSTFDLDLPQKSKDVWDIAIQSDGKILTVGSTRSNLNSCESTDVMIMRTDGTGMGDETFGTDDPNASTPTCSYLSSSSASYSCVSQGVMVNHPGCGRDALNAIALQADGKFVVAGGTEANTVPSPNQFLVARYLQDGSLDVAFGDQGMVIFTIGANECIANDVAIQPDGAIVTVGQCGTGTNVGDRFANLVRYTSSGALDSSFGNNGIVTTDISLEFYTLALQSDGKIVAAGRGNTSGVTVVARYDKDGSLDTEFGEEGFYHSTISGFGGINLMPDKKIMLSGNGVGNVSPPERLTSDGQLDDTFSAEPTAGRVYAATLQDDGKLLLAGISDPENTVTVWRYLNTISKPEFDPAVILMLLNRPQICDCENSDCDC